MRTERQRGVFGLLKCKRRDSFEWGNFNIMLIIVILNLQCTGCVILLDELVETVVAEGVAAGESNGFLEDISAESTG